MSNDPPVRSFRSGAIGLHDVVFKGGPSSSSQDKLSLVGDFLGKWRQKLGFESHDHLIERLALEGATFSSAEDRLSGFFESVFTSEFKEAPVFNSVQLGEAVKGIAIAGLRSIRLDEVLVQLVARLEAILLKGIEERIWYWLPHFKRDDHILFSDFPVLERLIWHEATRSARNFVEMLSRWNLDRCLISGLIGDKEIEGTEIVGLEPNKSEPHDQGRSVAILVLRGGRVVYKPRSVNFECRFQEFLHWLSEGTSPPILMPTIKVIERDGYGWCEFVEHADIQSSDQAGLCHRRLGFLMAVVYGLGGVDLIQDNVIVGMHGPVLIDAETMLQPLSCPAGAESHRSEVLTEVESWRSHSVIETGALPIWERRGDSGAFRNIGLTGPISMGGKSSAPMGHQIQIQGKVCDGIDYLDFILEGFSLGYHRLIEVRDALLFGDRSLSAWFVGCKIRFLPRPSSTYGYLIYRMMSPDALRSGLTFGLEPEVLLRPFFKLARFQGKPSRWDLTRREITCLTELEVPCFHLGVSDASDSWILLSAIDYASIQLKGLGDHDLERQIRLIRVGLSIRPAASPVPLATAAVGGSKSSEDSMVSMRLVEMACELGDRILHFSASPESLYSYAKYMPSGNDEQLIATSTVYGGRMGRALFFSELGRIANRDSYRDFAVREAIESASLICVNNWESALGCGGTGGLGGILFGYASLLGEEIQPGIVERWIGKMEELIFNERNLEFDRGLAGSVMALLGCEFGPQSDRAIKLAQSAGERIWKFGFCQSKGRDWTMEVNGFRILGFAHGYAGVAASFSRLFRVTGDSFWRDRCLSIWSELLRLGSSTGEGVWPAAVSDSLARLEGPVDAWCSGSPGIALAYTEMVSSGVVASSDVVQKFWPTAPSQESVDFLCCGKAGMRWIQAEILALRGECLSSLRSEWESGANSDFMRVYQTARTREECLLLPSNLFRGLSGIGLTHLRMVDPSTINVLSLAMPRTKKLGPVTRVTGEESK